MNTDQIVLMPDGLPREARALHSQSARQLGQDPRLNGRDIWDDNEPEQVITILTLRLLQEPLDLGLEIWAVRSNNDAFKVPRPSHDHGIR